jgi:AcrR family transcriptional regulator
MVRDANATASPAGPAEEDGSVPPADRILAAALVCMERDGIEATGIRDIAREAGVNSAAINYYFRSKDNLIHLALERSLDNAFGEIISELHRLRAEGLPIRTALEHVIDDYVRHVRDFPRLAYAHLRDALVNQQYDGAAVTRLNAFLEQLLEHLAAEPASARAAELRMLLLQAWGSLLLLGVLPRLFEPFLTLDFSEAEVRAQFVGRLLAPVYAWLDRK